VKNSTLDDHLAEKLNELGPWLSLMVVLVYEYLLGEKSRWFPYLRILPSDFDTPMFWDEMQLSELQASALVTKIGKKAADQSILDFIVPLIRSNPSLFPQTDAVRSWSGDDGANALLQLAHRMGSLIMAYAFDIDKFDEEESPDEDGYLTDEEEQPSKGMVPLADLLNADAGHSNVRSLSNRLPALQLTVFGNA
jgi:N-lysine methyltransferase SETD6